VKQWSSLQCTAVNGHLGDVAGLLTGLNDTHTQAIDADYTEYLVKEHARRKQEQTMKTYDQT